MPSVVVCADAGVDERRARTLAETRGLEFGDPSVVAADLVLALTAEGYELRERGDAPGRGIRIDFRRIDRRPANLSLRQPLARAMGGVRQQVVDATAGLGHDAALLTLFGHAVTAIERDPVIATLLEDAVTMATHEPDLGRHLAGRLGIMWADARTALPTLDPAPDVVYLDPMFPPKRKRSARAKRAIELVGRLVGADDDAAELLDVARAVARRRVVVKRPTDAGPLGGRPSGAIESKLVRYDVYGAGTG